MFGPGSALLSGKKGQVQSAALSEKVVWQLLQGYAGAAGVPGIAPHDLRRTCAKLCRVAGGELEQIQLLLGHASVQTTERYLGTKQDLVRAHRYRTTWIKRLSNSSRENMVRPSGASGRAITKMNCTIVSRPKGTSFISLTIAKLLSKSAID